MEINPEDLKNFTPEQFDNLLKATRQQAALVHLQTLATVIFLIIKFLF